MDDPSDPAESEKTTYKTHLDVQQQVSQHICDVQTGSKPKTEFEHVISKPRGEVNNKHSPDLSICNRLSETNALLQNESSSSDKPKQPKASGVPACSSKHKTK